MMKHSVVLDEQRCRGCTSCIKSCPTEAIRVRGRKATILADRCIDCGRCIHICPHKAIRSVGDNLSRLQDFSYCIALPEPALYGQFHRLDDVDIILNALLKIGFDKVWEVAKASELLADRARQEMKHGGHGARPQISSACPTVLRLIRMRFPKLIDHVAPTILPMELAAILARREAVAETGLAPEKIGVFAIVPCSSKVTAATTPEGLQKPVLDGAFAIRDIYLRLLSPMKDITDPEALSTAGILGIGTAASGGEGTARLGGRCVSVDGISNVIQVLEALEDGPSGRGGFRRALCLYPGVSGRLLQCGKSLCRPHADQGFDEGAARLPQPLPGGGPGPDAARQGTAVSALFPAGSGREQAMAKQLKIQELEAHLPGLHCGSCGAPSCHAFAEDVVMGRASEGDCIFKVRAKMRFIAAEGDPDSYLPAPFRHRADDTVHKG